MSDTEIVIATKDDWETTDMPDRHEEFILERIFTDKQMDILRHGNIPQEMEDKWFWYMEGNKLYAHRSWTGFCVYIVEFHDDNRHRVTVNRDMEQYRCTSIEEDRAILNDLFNWWAQPDYDHYGEWLAETVNMMQKSETNDD